jgi:hypothetical protein
MGAPDPTTRAATRGLRGRRVAWRARRNSRATPHDGLIRPDHPAIIRTLSRPQSATSLRQMVRDPAGYFWRYVLGWRDTVAVAAPLSLDDRAFGDLVHLLLQQTVAGLEPSPGFGRAVPHEVEAALAAAANEVADSWPLRRPAPPLLLWQHTLDSARALALAALMLDEPFDAGTRSWTELPFGDPDADPVDGDLPWDARETVVFPGTSFAVRGVIDRVELDRSDARARLTDYKTGVPPGAAGPSGPRRRPRPFAITGPTRASWLDSSTCGSSPRAPIAGCRATRSMRPLRPQPASSTRPRRSSAAASPCRARRRGVVEPLSSRAPGDR